MFLCKANKAKPTEALTQRDKDQKFKFKFKSNASIKTSISSKDITSLLFSPLIDEKWYLFTNHKTYNEGGNKLIDKIYGRKSI